MWHEQTLNYDVQHPLIQEEPALVRYVGLNAAEKADVLIVRFPSTAPQRSSNCSNNCLYIWQFTIDTLYICIVNN